MSKIIVAVVDPFQKTVEIEKIENSSQSFRAIINGGIDFKRLRLKEFLSIFDEDEDRETILLNGIGIIEGINIAVHNCGIIKEYRKFKLGNNAYTICYGKAIISGANINWENIDFPYSREFLLNNIIWEDETNKNYFKD